MKVRRARWMTMLALAAGLLIVGAVVREVADSVHVRPATWEPPVIATSTAEATVAAGWWQSMPTPPPWRTARATDAATETPGDEGEGPK